MVRRVILSVILITALLAVGFGGFALLFALRQRPEPITPHRPALRVQAVRLAPETVVARLSGYGTARAERRAVLGAEVAGTVLQRPDTLRPGAAVTAGDLLVRIDSREYQARLQQAQSRLAAEQAALAQLDIEEQNTRHLMESAQEELEIAEREFNRTRDLLESDASNQRELDAARVVVQRARRVLQGLQNDLALLPDRRRQLNATIELRQAEVALAALDVERCTIHAPFDGQVEEVDVELGERVQPGVPLITLLDPRRIEVPIELPLARRPEARVGAPVELQLESDPDTTWHGEIARIAPAADSATRTFSLYVVVENAPTGDQQRETPLIPGMFVQAEISGPTLADALLVPRRAVRQDQVFVARDGHAVPHAVSIRRRLRERAVIEGLAAGEIVITSNLDALYDGAPVEPLLDTPLEPSSVANVPQPSPRTP